MRGLSPRLRRILVAYTINQLGTWFGYVALSVAVYDRTHSVVATAALFLAGRFLPALLVPWLVARAELSRGGRQLTLLYAFEAAVTGVLAVLARDVWLPAVFLLVAVDGAAALTASALLRAAAGRSTPVSGAKGLGVPAAVEDGVAPRHANAALNVAFSATVAVGPALAGLSVAAFGASDALIIDAITFLACSALLVGTRLAVDRAGPTAGSQLREAWRHLQAVPQLRSMLVAEAGALIFFTSIQPVEIAYVKSSLRAGDSAYGLLLAVWGSGQVLGSVVFARSSHRTLSSLLSAGTLAVGLAYIGYAAAPTLAVAAVAAVVGGLGNGVQWASLVSLVQQLSPARLHGRLMGAVESVGALFPGVGFLIGASVSVLISPRAAFMVAGIAAVIMTSVFVRIFASGAATHTSSAAPEDQVRRELAEDRERNRETATFT